MARRIGIEGTDAAALAALRAAPAEQIVDGLTMSKMGQAGDTYAGGPIIDGTIVTGTTEDMLKAGNEAPVPVIIGATNADAAFGAALPLDEALARFGSRADLAREAYDPDNTGNPAIANLIGADKTMAEPARFVARTVASHGRPAWVFRFSYVAESVRDQLPGAVHASEIPYVFDTLAANYGDRVTPQDQAVARDMHAYWVNFARTGDPNGADLPEWPKMTANGDDILDFTEAGPVGGPDPWKVRLDLVAATTLSAQ